MMPSSSDRSRPRARVCNGTFSISASEGRVPATSTTLFAAQARAVSLFAPRFTVASGDSNCAETRNGVSRIRPSPFTATALPIRASSDRMSSIPRSASSRMRGSR